MKAIITKYHGPTNTRGSRISATDSDGNRVSISYPYDRDPHRAAAAALCAKMRWSGTLVQGGTSNGAVFVWYDPADSFTV